MIPKKIHYCWFGGKPLTPLAEKCIASWRKYLPNYEIKRWDESNYDVNSIPYTQEAYESKKYAFVSDYARFKILYDEGGLYFDTDVEVIRPIDDIIATGPFMGCENAATSGVNPGLSLGVNPGLGLGANPGLGLYKEIIKLYETLHFRKKNGELNTKTIVEYTTECLVKKGLVNSPNIQEIDGVNIYPVDYFCPIDYLSGEIKITNNTYTIHHYSASWKSPTELMTLSIYRNLNCIPTQIRGYLAKLIATYKIEGLKGCLDLIFTHFS